MLSLPPLGFQSAAFSRRRTTIWRAMPTRPALATIVVDGRSSARFSAPRRQGRRYFTGLGRLRNGRRRQSLALRAGVAVVAEIAHAPTQDGRKRGVSGRLPDGRLARGILCCRLDALRAAAEVSRHGCGACRPAGRDAACRQAGRRSSPRRPGDCRSSSRSARKSMREVVRGMMAIR